MYRVEFKSVHFLVFLLNSIKWDSSKIFNPNKKQNGAIEQISTFYSKFMTSASDLTSIQPHIWWRDLTKKLPVEYGLVGPAGLDQRWLNLHGSMQWYIIQSRHVQKIQENFDIIFFSYNFHFFWGHKNCRKLEKKTFLIFCE